MYIWREIGDFIIGNSTSKAMLKFKKTQLQKIEGIRKRKERACQKTKSILTDICKDNPEIFKKDPVHRIKDVDSIAKKMGSKKCYDIKNIEKYVDDIAGARVTCCTHDEIPKAEKLIKQHPDIKKCKVTKMWNDMPDDFGYRGHHLIVTVAFSYNNRTIRDTCEIQIRTLAMDLWAILSHRDIYKAPVQASPLIQKDMANLSQILATVDNLAVTLKQRRRDEIDNKVKETQEGKAQRDMLTPKNIRDLINKEYKTRIPLEEAYSLIQYALSYKIVSLKNYKALVAHNSKYQKALDKLFHDNGVEPKLIDRFYAPILIKALGIKKSKSILMSRVKKYSEAKDIKVGEKGAEISKDKLAKTVKVSQLQQGKK